MSPFTAYEFARMHAEEQQAAAERRRRLGIARGRASASGFGRLRGRRRGGDDLDGCRA